MRTESSPTAQPRCPHEALDGLRIDGARAIWIDETTIALPHTLASDTDAPGSAAPSGHTPSTHTPSGHTRPGSAEGWWLLASPRAGIEVRDARLHGVATSIALMQDREGLTAAQARAHPDLVAHRILRLPTHWRRSVPELLTGQLLLAHEHWARVDLLTGVQLGPVIDAVHGPAARGQELGPVLGAQRIALRLWAPTAQSVTLLLWGRDAGAAPPVERAERRTMLRDASGTWTTRVPRELLGARYLFEVHVYSSATGRIETNLVTDPYSAGLTVDSQRSVLVDLDDAAAMPAGWADSHGPRLARLVDASIYELHVRDFSMSDELVPEPLRGSYLAFTVDGHATRHLRHLARHGLNTVHLLPCFDITSVPEADPSPGPCPADLAALPPDSPEQQRLVAATADVDGFNWGYDPYHWGTPEGSYASSPEAADGITRVAEFRAMVAALHDMGLRVVLDQVFTHTAASGQHPASVLDRIVPGYYHRLDAAGAPQASTCMNNVATERVMAEKLMIDMVLRWVRAYHVDGFRFDLMGHSSARNMANLREALDELTMAADGVVGSDVYLYGEGWNFGEVANNALFVQATQGQLASSRVATFNDRIRDAVRGGAPFDEDPRRQGFGTGLAGDPNGAWCNRDGERRLGELTDLLMLSLAGNLRDYRLSCHDGVLRRGDEIDYLGVPAGYADEPCDALSYVDAHDNETLWDALTLKLPRELALAERIRMNTLCLATVTLGQSPFLWHAGADLLRSKSLDRNSYNSGDWFNRFDVTGADNGFGHGLPPAADNMTRWPWLKPLLADPSLKPGPDEVLAARDQACELLRVRRWSRLLRLGRAADIHAKLSFPVAGGPLALPGVVVMHVDDRVGRRLDASVQGVVVAFNASPDTVEQEIPTLAGARLALCPVQHGGVDERVRATRFEGATLHLPGRTVAVLAHQN